MSNNSEHLVNNTNDSCSVSNSVLLDSRKRRNITTKNINKNNTILKYNTNINQRSTLLKQTGLQDNATQRALSLGLVGKYLFSHLISDDLNDGLTNLEQHSTKLELISKQGNQRRAMSYSMLVSTLIVQVETSDAIIKELVGESFIKLRVNDSNCKAVNLDEEGTEKIFKIKTHEGAYKKTNVWFTEAWSDLKAVDSTMAYVFQSYSNSMLGFTNDQAAACVIMAKALSIHYVNHVELAIQLVKYPEDAKNLTKVIKSLGLNRCVLGATVCEGQVLQGKGIGSVNLEEECRKRCGIEGIKNTPDILSDEQLRKAIRVILKLELGDRKIEFPTLDEKWTRRWLWCTNGGHGAPLGRMEPALKVDLGFRIHRKVAMENWENNAIANWNGKSYTSASRKLEPGKERLILSTDTVTYAAFEHLLSEVEAKWINSRVLLSPGKDPTSVMCRRIKDMRGSYFCMMDYDDFNSHHTNRSMEILFEETVKYTGYDSVLGKKLCDSFYKNRVFAGGVDCGYATATLMSGHRGTTYINSMLNAAYTYCAIPNDWLRVETLHTGDDVVSKFDDLLLIDTMVNRMAEMGCRLNRMKQSVGRYSAEFLRCCIGPVFAIGYLPRGVIEAVNGNWVTEDPLQGLAGVTALVSCVRTIINRSQNPAVSDLFISSASRYMKVKRSTLRGVLAGGIALGNGPVFTCSSAEYKGTAVVSGIAEYRDSEMGVYPRFATNDYLTYHSQPIERLGLTLAGLSVQNSMVRASYAKSLPEGAGDVKLRKSIIRLERQRVALGSVGQYEALALRPWDGVLTKYPLLMLASDRLSNKVIAELLQSEGYKDTYGMSLRVFAFGGESFGKIIRGALPYSEACSLCRRVSGDIVYVSYNIYM